MAGSLSFVQLCFRKRSPSTPRTPCCLLTGLVYLVFFVVLVRDTHLFRFSELGFFPKYLVLGSISLIWTKVVARSDRFPLFPPCLFPVSLPAQCSGTLFSSPFSGFTKYMRGFPSFFFNVDSFHPPLLTPFSGALLAFESKTSRFCAGRFFFFVSVKGRRTFSVPHPPPPPTTPTPPPPHHNPPAPPPPPSYSPTRLAFLLATVSPQPSKSKSPPRSTLRVVVFCSNRRDAAFSPTSKKAAHFSLLSPVLRAVPQRALFCLLHRRYSRPSFWLYALRSRFSSSFPVRIGLPPLLVLCPEKTFLSH